MNKIKERIQKFTRKEWIYISIWSSLNFLFLIVLLFAAGASIISSLAYFIFWEICLFGYYMIRVRKGEKDTKGREWVDAIAFAVITATIIKTFMVDAFTIPTPSMEKNMMVGDFLFVSKWNYGTRVPNTPVSFPFVHNTLPGGSGDSYLEIFELPYWRFPATEQIDRNDVVVFNYPGPENRNDKRPVDKRENYIKRCVGIAGDTLQVINQQVYINGKVSPLPEGVHLQHRFKVTYKQGFSPNKALLKDEFDINAEDIRFIDTYFEILIPEDRLADFKAMNGVDSVVRIMDANPEFPVFPDLYWSANQKSNDWTVDNYGPVYIPKAGDVIELNARNIWMYRRCIELYEGNTFEIAGNKVLINGQEASSYTFKMNYYWMMGDNRHNSADSRYWGFVPEDHIVGKAWFVWFSYDKHASSFFSGIRWSRMFTGVK